jgi:hypothetical protein
LCTWCANIQITELPTPLQILYASLGAKKRRHWRRFFKEGIYAEKP